MGSSVLGEAIKQHRHAQSMQGCQSLSQGGGQHQPERLPAGRSTPGWHAQPCQASPSLPSLGRERCKKLCFSASLHEAPSLIPHLEARVCIPNSRGRAKRGEQAASLIHHCHSSQLFSTGRVQLRSTLLGKKVPRKLLRCLLCSSVKELSCDEDPLCPEAAGDTHGTQSLGSLPFSGAP